jgi:hypothetical protein
MDPVSLTAAVIGIAGSITVVNDVVRLASSLQNAPLEFLDLQNEVSKPKPLLKHPLDFAHSPCPCLVGDGSRLPRCAAVDTDIPQHHRRRRAGGGGPHRTDPQLARERRGGATRLIRYLPAEQNWECPQDSVETTESSHHRAPR